MSSNQASAETKQARILFAHPAFPAGVNDILEGPAAAIDALAATGDVDAAESAVAHALASGGKVVALPDDVIPA